MTQKVSSVAVVNSAGHLLMGQRRENHRWNTPGGKANPDETPEETARRELLEETGLTVDELEYLGCGSPHPDLVVHSFKAKVPSGSKPTNKSDPDSEIVGGWQWVDVSKGLPKHIKSSLHNPQDVTLGLLDLMPLVPEPQEQSQDTSLTKDETSIDLHVCRLHPDISTAKIKIITKTEGDWHYAQALHKGQVVATLKGLQTDTEALILDSSFEDHYQALQKPLLRAFARVPLEKAEPTDLHQALTERSPQAYKALQNAKFLPEDIQNKALDPTFMGTNPDHVAAILSRPDLSSDYLRQASYIAARRSLHPNVAGFIFRALANNERLPANSVATVFDGINSSHDNSQVEYRQNTRAIGTLLDRPDLHADDFIRMAIHSRFANAPDVSAVLEKRPEFRDPLRDNAFQNGDVKTLNKYDLKLTPAQVNLAAGGPNNYMLHRVLEHQSQDIEPKTLQQLWSSGTGKWNQEAVNRLPPEAVEEYLKSPKSIYMDEHTIGAFQHPGLTSKSIGDILDTRRQQFNQGTPPCVLLNPGLGEEQRQALWSQVDPWSKRTVIDRLPAPYVSSWLRDPNTSATDISGAIQKLVARPDLTYPFWDHELEFPGASGQPTKLGMAATANGDVLGALSRLGGPVAAKMAAVLKPEEHAFHAIDWRNAHPDLITRLGERGIANVAPKHVFEGMGRDTGKAMDVLNGRLQEQGFGNPNRMVVIPGQNKLRQLRALAAENQGVHDKDLKTMGVNLGAQGMGKLLDSQGKLHAEALDRHMASLTPQEWAWTESQWAAGSGQTHSKAKQKVFQLNMPPEKRVQLDALGLGPIYDRIVGDQGGHPVHGRHGAGWVRYTEKPDGIHIDEIQTDIGPNLVSHLKQHENRARALGHDPLKTKQLVDFVWGKSHPSEVLHEAFLQHLREQGKTGTNVHLWQLQPKMKLANQREQDQPPAHMRETYDKQPKKMGYSQGQYGQLKTQTNKKLRGQPTWAQILKAEGEPVQKSELDIENMLDRPDIGRDRWGDKLKAALRGGGIEAYSLASRIALNPNVVRHLDSEEISLIFNKMKSVGRFGNTFLRTAKLTSEQFIQAARETRASQDADIVGARSPLISIFENPHLGNEERNEIWDTASVPTQIYAVTEAGVDTTRIETLVREATKDAQLHKLLPDLNDVKGIGADTWKRWLQPGGVLHEKVNADPYMLDYLPPKVTRTPDLADELLPAMQKWVEHERAGTAGTKYQIDRENYRSWWNQIPDSTIKKLNDSGYLPAVQGSEDYDERLRVLGLRTDETVEVRPRLNKLRQLRDKVQEAGGTIDPKALGLNLGSMGLGHLKDSKGLLTTDKIQQHIDHQPTVKYSFTHGNWKGAQRHSGDPSKVFQVNVTPETMKEIEHQKLTDAYHKLLNMSQDHPHHKKRGLGWVRYTENPDGIHIDEIQTDFGHKTGAFVKENGNKPEVQQRLPTNDEYQRLQKLFWQGHHPSEILHEAFLQHLRNRGDATGDQGKEIHIWQAKAKAAISGQDINKLLPAHIQATYDQQPQKMGYDQDRYGVLSTQDNERLQTNLTGTNIPHYPTWSSRLRKWELDSLSWLADNGEPEMLEKASKIGKQLWTLAAAGALNIMTPSTAQEAPMPHPAEQQTTVDFPGVAPMTGKDAQTVPIKTEPLKWHAHNLNPELRAIAQLESGFGKYLNHAKNPTDYTTAYGSLGFKPETGHTEWHGSPALKKLYPGLESKQDFTTRFKADPNFYNDLGNHHWWWLKKNLGGDTYKAALAWRWGLAAVQGKTDAELEHLDSAEGYAKKYRALTDNEKKRKILTKKKDLSHDV